jgi:type IV pilus assembly protein PilM
MSDTRVFTLKSFLNFPPPLFLSMPAAGINFSDHSVKMVRFPSHDPSKIITEKISLDGGVISSGEVLNPKEITNILSTLRKKHKLELVRVSIPEEKAYIFNLVIADSGEEEIRNTIHYQVPEHVPLRADEIVFDYDIISRDEKNKTLDVSISVLPLEIVEQYLSICKDARLRPLSFELEAQATSRALVASGDHKTRMIVDIGKTRTGISIVSGHAVRYTSTAEIGGDLLTQAIEKFSKVSYEEADRMKQEIGFTKTRTNDDLYLSMATTLSALKDEIITRVMFWQEYAKKTNLQGATIESVIICGGNASVPGLREYFETCLGLPVELGNVWSNILSLEEAVPPLPFRQSLYYATAIGLAISSE